MSHGKKPEVEMAFSALVDQRMRNERGGDQNAGNTSMEHYAAIKRDSVGSTT